MDPPLSQTVGRILGKGSPTPEERARVVAALGAADTWRELPRDIQDLLNAIKRRTPKTLPGGRNATTR